MATVNFETEECCECGICFQVTKDFAENRKQDGRSFYCPNGHEQAYDDTPGEQMEKLEAANFELQAEVRRLKCRLLGRPPLLERARAWWRAARGRQ